MGIDIKILEEKGQIIEPKIIQKRSKIFKVPDSIISEDIDKRIAKKFFNDDIKIVRCFKYFEKQQYGILVHNIKMYGD